MKIYLSPLETVVMLYNISIHRERDIGADFTYCEIVQQLGDFRYSYSKELIETGLFFCNMNAEAGAFWHPLNVPFKSYAYKIGAHNKVRFNTYYNHFQKEDESASQ